MKLALLGGGGHCRSCIEVIRSAGLEIAGIVMPETGDGILGCPRLGDDGWLDTSAAMAMHFLVTIGQTNVSPHRARLFNMLRERSLNLVKVVAESAIASRDAQIGEGTIIMHRAMVNAGATVGSNCIINTAAIVEHDAHIADHCHVSTGAIVNGGARIGTGCMIGSGAIVLQGVSIAADVLIGAGTVVNRSIDAAGMWVGVPARRLQ